MSQRKVHVTNRIRSLYDIDKKMKGYGVNVTEKSPSVIWYLKENEMIWNECHREKSISYMIFWWKRNDMEGMSEKTVLQLYGI